MTPETVTLQGTRAAIVEMDMRKISSWGCDKRPRKDAELLSAAKMEPWGRQTKKEPECRILEFAGFPLVDNELFGIELSRTHEPSPKAYFLSARYYLHP